MKGSKNFLVFFSLVTPAFFLRSESEGVDDGGVFRGTLDFDSALEEEGEGQGEVVWLRRRAVRSSSMVYANSVKAPSRSGRDSWALCFVRYRI